MLPDVAGAMVSVGAPVPWMAVGNAQNPPVTEYWPLVLAPPPLAIFDQSIE